MLEFLYHISDAQVFLFMVSLTIFFSLLLIVMNKFFVFYKLRYRDNTTTASIATLIGTIYGVLAGFICLYLINNVDHAATAALDEGTAAANIYRESRWLKDPMQHVIQANLKNYLGNVVTIEWPAMAQGKTLAKENGYNINKMSDQLMQYPIVTQADIIIINDLLQEIKNLFKGREERIHMSEAQLSPEIWQVILISTILIIVINYAFRVNFYLHIFSLTAFAVMAASVLFLLVTLDRPFQGEFVVVPEAIQSVLDLMDHDAKEKT